jgi:hypothetical protein
MLTRKVSQKMFKVFAGGLFVLFGTGLAMSQTASAPVSSAGDGAVLQAVPAEAWGAVLFKNMGQTSQAVDAYAVKLGVGEVGLQRKLSRMLGVSGQIDMTKPMVLVVMSKERFGNQPIALVVTVKEYEKFAADLKSKTTETPGLMKGSNEELGDVFFGKKDAYLVMGPTEAIVKSVIVSKGGIAASMDPSAQKLMTDSDVYARVNFLSLGQFLKPTLMGIGAMMQMGAMGGMGGMGGDAQADNAQAQAQMQAMQSAGVMINALVGFLDETNSFDIGIKLDPKFVHAGFLFSFKPGQEIAKSLAAQKQSDKPLVRGVAGNDFALAAGWNWESKVTKFQQAIFQMNPGFADPADFDKFKALNTQLVEMNRGQAVMVSMAKPEPGKPLFTVQQVTETTDAKKFVEVTRQVMELQGKAKMGGGQMKMKYEQGVAQVDGISVDRVTMDMNSMLSMPGMAQAGAQAEQLQAVLKGLLGAEDGTISFHMAPATEKRVVLFFGGNEEGMAKLIKAAKADATPLSTNPKVIEVAKTLPKQRLMEGYVDVGRLATGFMAMAMMAGDDGAEAPATIPAIQTPLVGAAVSVDGNTIMMNVAVPFEVVQNLMNLRYMVPMGGMDSDSDLDSDSGMEVDLDGDDSDEE